ncbi:MAG TPA: GNAT family N-acetyltransferase [Candidatus Acidoferrales bacterium]|jgi:predicted GNAT superfamily acetyltransferase|nr:GNAT family N-acetyltransferase [Candidatus Acidoferrales bacterium]
MTAPTRAGEIQIRHCHGLDEFQACYELQQRVWGETELDVPLPLFVVAAETGGQVLGAFDGEKMVGFTLALTGYREDTLFLHSHMTAVLEAYRDRGIGRRLKRFQREDAINRGIGLVEWTFDPLEVKNAYLNLMRLGAIARRYVPNCYGITSSPLHRGMPTDRLVAEWWLESPRVETLLDGRGIELQTPPSERAQILVPAGIPRLRRDAPAEALQVQTELREQFQKWLGQGFVATGIEIGPEGGRYILEPWRNFSEGNDEP